MKKFGTAVILCGGKSNRMGFDKSLVKVRGKYLIEIIGEKLEKIFDNILLVTNDLEKIKGLKYKGILDIIPGMGPVGAIYTALRASDSKYVYVTACDMPAVNLSYIRYMMEIIENEDPDGVVARSASFIEPLNAFYSVNMLHEFESGIENDNLRIFGPIKNSKVHFVDYSKAQEYCRDIDMFANINYQMDLNLLERICTEDNKLISIEEAIRIITEEARLLEAEERPLLSSLKRVLAEDIYARDNLPPFDKSAMDGFAVRSADGPRLKVIEVIKAGDPMPAGPKSGEAYRIMTGAPIPEGADAVIKKEEAITEGEFATLLKPVKKGQNILSAGEEIKEGDLALRSGTTLRPAEIGLLASLGCSAVKTYRAPRIALLITGDELVGIDEDLSPGKIRNCNEYSLTAMANDLNAEVISSGIVRDDPEVILEKMREAFENADIVVSSGGASVGDYDFIERILRELGADMKFSAIAIKPGKPVIFATYRDKLFFGLPGNPLSAISTFEQFVSPAIKKMMGIRDLTDEQFPVVLADDIKCSTGRTNYAYVNIEKKDGVYYAHRVGSQSSNALVTICRANGVVIIDGTVSTAKAGEIVSGKFIFK